MSRDQSKYIKLRAVPYSFILFKTAVLNLLRLYIAVDELFPLFCDLTLRANE